MPDDLPTWWHERRFKSDRRDWSQQAHDDSLWDEEQAHRLSPSDENEDAEPWGARR